MRIPCPYCGPRSNEEFVYHGDATLLRPAAVNATADAGAKTDPGAAANAERAAYDYVYLRNNPAGRHSELWFHAAGCHAWLVVERDTRTHVIFGAKPARAESTGAAQ